MPVLRSRNAALLAVIESVEGTFQAPSAATDGILVENPQISFDPQNVETNEVTGSLDGRGPILGGLQASLSFRAYLKGSGVPGTPPEYGDILKACALSETITNTSITGTTFSITGGNTIADSANGLAALTAGTAIALIIAGAFIGEFLVATSSAASITVTKMDGSAPGLTNAAAGPTFDIRRGVAAIVASAGTVNSFTAIAPWAATDQLYTGVPVWLSTNPATPLLTAMDDYSVARVAKIVETLGAALSATTKASIPAHVLYKPFSGAVPSLSLEAYMDGVRYRFSGVRGDASFSMNAAGACWADITLRGMYTSKADAAVPVVTYDGTRPGTFRASRMTVNRQLAALQTFGLNLGNQLVFPPNPNAAEGFDPPNIMSRRVGGSIDPLATLVATRDLMNDFRMGNEMPIHGRVLGGVGAVAGNRVGLTVPKAFYESYQPGDNQGMMNEQLGFFARGQDSGFQLAVF